MKMYPGKISQKEDAGAIHPEQLLFYLEMKTSIISFGR